MGCFIAPHGGSYGPPYNQGGPMDPPNQSKTTPWGPPLGGPWGLGGPPGAPWGPGQKRPKKCLLIILPFGTKLATFCPFFARFLANFGQFLANFRPFLAIFWPFFRPLFRPFFGHYLGRFYHPLNASSYDTFVDVCSNVRHVVVRSFHSLDRRPTIDPQQLHVM